MIPGWTKAAVQEARPIGGIWEPAATFDTESPAFYYRVKLTCFKIESCMDIVKIYVSDLRDALGEGPFTGIYTGLVKIITFADLIWASAPQVSDDQQRFEEFALEMQSYTKPVVTDVP